jgi:hypothetical protein
MQIPSQSVTEHQRMQGLMTAIPSQSVTEHQRMQGLMTARMSLCGLSLRGEPFSAAGFYPFLGMAVSAAIVLRY